MYEWTLETLPEAGQRVRIFVAGSGLGFYESGTVVAITQVNKGTSLLPNNVPYVLVIDTGMGQRLTLQTGALIGWDT